MVREWKQFVKILKPEGRKVLIRLLRRGCANRPFYQIGVVPFDRWRTDLPAREVIGSFDPMENEAGEKLVAVNLDRFYYWIGQGASMDNNLARIMGLSGVMPIPPDSYERAWKSRQKDMEPKDAKKEQAEESA